jgi:rod shape-determining protein MreC
VAPPSRSARAAVLASSVQRSKPTPYPSRARSALIRRAIVVGLVIVALALVTISFRSPTSGALHDVQGAGSTALRPFQIAATRIAQPFRDAYDYVDGLANARADNKRLKKINENLRERDIQTKAQAALLPSVLKQLHFVQGPSFPTGFNAISTSVTSPPGGPFAHTLAIDAGSSSGVRVNSPVVSGDGLVGIVSNVFPHTAKVTLLTDPDSFASARDVDTQVRGMLHTGPGGTLILDQVRKELRVKEGDKLVTAGTHNAQYPDLYPYGIPIGTVTSVSATDTATFLQVQVQPFANLGALESVAVLVPKKSRR